MKTDHELKVRQAIEKLDAANLRSSAKFIGRPLCGRKLLATDGHVALVSLTDKGEGEALQIGPDPTSCHSAMVSADAFEAFDRLAKITPKLPGYGAGVKITLNGDMKVECGNHAFTHSETVGCDERDTEEVFTFTVNPHMAKLGIVAGMPTLIRYSDPTSAMWLEPRGENWALLVMPMITT